MTGLENMDPKLRREYTGVVGEVIWSYHSCDGRGLVYVVDDRSGWLVEVRASEVQA